MIAIYKYPLRHGFGPSNILMPEHRKILCSRFQGPTLTIWAMVDTNDAACGQNFLVLPTGELHGEDFDNYQYLATQELAGLIFHVFFQRSEAEIAAKLPL